MSEKLDDPKERARQARLAAALRENLKRRKAQARGRAAEAKVGESVGESGQTGPADGDREA
ncbi:MAG TPA: hypothetical protein VNZ94_07920 [Xanthobacteraceae bacterium]|nr:hypothetical protein [Xanthobacteraceae bacterium]